MNNSLITASVSMHALQRKLDMLSNNIANINTAGYKRMDASFQDVLTSVKQQPMSFQQQGRLSPLGYNHGWGSRLVQAQMDMAQGSLAASDNPLDVAIEGNGLFEIASADGSAPVYTRDGSFDLRPDTDPTNMVLTTKDGGTVIGVNDDPIRIPVDHRIQIQSDGTILAFNDADKTAAPVQAGQLKLMRVLRPQLLQPLGNNQYTLAGGIANPDVLQPAANNAETPITVKQGFVEQSNVNLADEMTDLLQVQRAFQLNARAVTSSETMMGIANNLRNS
ncbi:flagellar hook-basal body protein [Paenibacillus xerothermodurans]|uniref:Flagellar hook-basal body protein n=1 Tax=Paenibacillus xerothermodurans TaxID=1977292 RepID=A0A2W1N893_PAEXE|nr:flagellar hook-basal body protein [Paenibacillus xerothermodurans]PZE19381.1 flagellar hook-basal body protein [Paenibacillus xerothermodurans]